MIRRRAVPLVLVGLFVWAAACSSYRTIDAKTAGNYDIVVVETTSRIGQKLRDPEFASDSLRGKVQEPSRLGGPTWSDSIVSIPVDSIVAVGVRETSETTKVWLVFGGVVILGLFVAAAASAPFR